MKTWQKILLAVIICMTWGMLSLFFLSSSPKGNDPALFIICTLSCSIAIRITLWLKLFLRFPKELVMSITYAAQFVVYSIIASAIAIVIYKNSKTIIDSDKTPESSHD